MFNKLYIGLGMLLVASLFVVACVYGVKSERARLEHKHQHQHNIPHSHRILE